MPSVHHGLLSSANVLPAALTAFSIEGVEDPTSTARRPSTRRPTTYPLHPCKPAVSPPPAAAAQSVKERARRGTAVSKKEFQNIVKQVGVSVPLGGCFCCTAAATWLPLLVARKRSTQEAAGLQGVGRARARCLPRQAAAAARPLSNCCCPAKELSRGHTHACIPRDHPTHAFNFSLYHHIHPPHPPPSRAVWGNPMSTYTLLTWNAHAYRPPLLAVPGGAGQANEQGRGGAAVPRVRHQQGGG